MPDSTVEEKASASPHDQWRERIAGTGPQQTYDKFGASGNLIARGFLNTGQFSFTGIGFDGRTYYVSDEEGVSSTLRLSNASSAPLGSVTLTGALGQISSATWKTSRLR